MLTKHNAKLIIKAYLMKNSKNIKNKGMIELLGNNLE